MSLSDCENCWDTPCICGHQGYTVVWHRESDRTINETLKLSKELFIRELKKLDKSVLKEIIIEVTK